MLPLSSPGEDPAIRSPAYANPSMDARIKSAHDSPSCFLMSSVGAF